MSRTCSLLFASSLLLGSCAGRVHVAAPAVDHPASPEAPEAASTQRGSALVKDRQDSARASVPTLKVGAHAGHGAMDMERGRTEENAPAQPSGAEATPSTTKESTETFTCPMHPEVVSKEPGKCPKCGMTLVRREHAP